MNLLKLPWYAFVSFEVHQDITQKKIRFVSGTVLGHPQSHRPF
jgi:hypothetical protein